MLPPERIPSGRNTVTSDIILPNKSHCEAVEMSQARCSDVDALGVKYFATLPYTITHLYNLRNSLCNVKKVRQSARSCLNTSRVDQLLVCSLVRVSSAFKNPLFLLVGSTQSTQGGKHYYIKTTNSQIKLNETGKKHPLWLGCLNWSTIQDAISQNAVRFCACVNCATNLVAKQAKHG